MIKYQINESVSAEELGELFRSSGIRRPDEDYPRLTMMIENSNLIVTARDGETLVGIARALTDFCYCCYLSDLAVRKSYQQTGVGKELVEVIKKEIGEQTMLLLLSAPEAMEYYPKIGFESAGNAFLINRRS